jgi:hypothetical protein
MLLGGVVAALVLHLWPHQWLQALLASLAFPALGWAVRSEHRKRLRAEQERGRMP